MTVYVDTPMLDPCANAYWSHLYSDGSAEELDDFAWALGVVKALTGEADYVCFGRCQQRARHYRVTRQQRALALQRGARRRDVTEFYWGDWEAAS